MEKKIYSNEPTSQSVVVNCSKVWIGDPCYALSDEVYDNICLNDQWYDCKLGNNDSDVFGVVAGTKYGDGAYDSAITDSYYGVDSGTLCMLDYDKCDGDCIDDGSVFELDSDGEHELMVTYKDGIISFFVDGIQIEEIPTGDYDEDDDDYWEDDDCDEEDEFEDED